MSGRLWQRYKGKVNASKETRSTWWIDIYDNDKNRIVLKIGPRDLAERVLHKFNELKMNGKLHKDLFDQTMDHYFDQYLSDKKNEVANYEALKKGITYLKKWFGEYKASDMTQELFHSIEKKWLKPGNHKNQGKCRKRIKNSSRNKRVRELKAVVNHHDLNNEIIAIERLPEENGGRRTLIINDEEREKLLQESKDIEMTDIMIILRYTGIRIGTLIRIRTNHVDLKNYKIQIPAGINKGKINGYSIDIDERVLNILENRIYNPTHYYNNFRKNSHFRKSLQLDNLQENHFLFPGTSFLGAESYKAFIEMKFRKLHEKCSIEDCVLHDFRRTFATSAYLKTGDLYAVSHALGHQSVITTERYLNLQVGDIQSLFEPVNNLKS